MQTPTALVSPSLERRVTSLVCDSLIFTACCGVLLLWYVVEPLAVWGILLWIWPAHFGSVSAAVVTVLVANLVLNSRFGVAKSPSS